MNNCRTSVYSKSGLYTTDLKTAVRTGTFTVVTAGSCSWLHPFFVV